MSSSKHMEMQAHTRRQCYKKSRGALSEPQGIPPHLGTMSWMDVNKISVLSPVFVCAAPAGDGAEGVRAAEEAPVWGFSTALQVYSRV